MMRVLVACETSGAVRDAFRLRGHDAVSCDLLPTVAPGPHYQGDVMDIVRDGWDLMVAHPPCTYLSSSGMHWTTRGLRDPQLTEDALDLVRALMAAPVPMIAIENPIGCISTRIRKPDQIIQPYQFGDDASKATCLWLRGLPLLEGTCRVPGRIVTHNGKQVERWANQTDSGQNRLPPSADRWKIRSNTYPGIAAAMAEQWSAPAAQMDFFDPSFDPAEKSKGPLTADPCQNGAPGRSRTSDLLVRSHSDSCEESTTCAGAGNKNRPDSAHNINEIGEF